MTSKRSTIGTNPLDALLSDPAQPKKHQQNKRDKRERSSSTVPLEDDAKREKARLTVHLFTDIIERARNAVYWTPGLTLAGLAESGFESELKKLEEEHGGPFPQRREELKGGRPVK